ncbi:hypothetical protein B842_05965 [Corynebacterium humireducens NBRC 106098 = DSM 45392]|uniref:DUF368 domain-containing protein n=1 Tax=Corynebacterium humireducens NBRC 106098 = DSM 45392 TaxID=1223515 RepID=A0A0B5D7B7_9CORY|nr:DUF368 domain-containing protein [Corynebacterium humireducens]AJE33042.1 hypothetical protein B842_05965 [Corynebacterium humireducens NBRC 106098 = DSM 45392]
MTTTHHYPARTRRTPLHILANLIRGALIGMAELVPGISGGTVALVVGVYERALNAANQLLRRQFSQVDWPLLIAIGVGMVTAVFTMSTVLSNFVENSPEYARALFLGMVAVSIWVPLAMMDPRDLRRRLGMVIPLFLVAAVVGFLGTSVVSAPQEDPSLIVIFLAATVAICALVLPGISGSYMLLAMGLYAPVIGAVSDRNWTVILTFMAGAAVGIILFIKVLTWALEKHRTVSLTLMAGLMLGSLRSLWPWQDADANLLSPGDNVLAVVGLIVLGGAVVAVFIIADRVATTRRESEVVAETLPA